jgi:hypothetical protein
MDDEHYFIRGNIEIPVFDEKQVFSWDVWVSHSKENFDKQYQPGVQTGEKRS